jgi:hypothetical protein
MEVLLRPLQSTFLWQLKTEGFKTSPARTQEKKKKKKKKSQANLTFSGGLDFTKGYYLGKIFSVIVST